MEWKGDEFMQRIKNLNLYQKGVLIFMVLMALAFAVIYPHTISRVGYRYNDSILVPTQEDGKTIYSGKIQGEPTQFIVSEDSSIVLRHGDKIYGPYIVKEDPTAIPKEHELSKNMTGIEVHEGERLLFRGGIEKYADFYWLSNEDGSPYNMINFSYMTSDGIERDEHGNPIDKMKPSVSEIYELWNGPELTHKGDSLAWFGAVFVCILNTVSILFADELFRWNLAFQIRNAEHAEPSEWELAGRYIGWTVITIMALVIFITGLQ